jgi:hypothetical protein
LFWINVAMLCTFWAWGMVNPRLTRRGIHADHLIARGLPLSFVALALIILVAGDSSNWTGVLWALYCMACTCVSLAQPAVGMAFPAYLAGRALSAYNLVIFVGVFAVQWSVGLAVDGFKALGLTELQAFQSAMVFFLLGSMGAYGYFLIAKSHNEAI